MQNEAGSEPFAKEKIWWAGIEPPGAILWSWHPIGASAPKFAPDSNQTASWEVNEAARVEDLQRLIKQALGNASVAATKKVQFCPITAIYSK